MKLAEIPGLPSEPAIVALATLTDAIGEVLVKWGGTITDVGYCFPDSYAEIVIRAPDGTQIELRARVL